jgi:uncharacterized MAPEG superfamily protein
METDASLPIEIVVLGLSVLLVLVQLALQAMLATRELGRDYNASPRDEERKPRGVHAGRAERAFRNLMETYPLFAALALGLVVTGQAGGFGATGAVVWFAARLAYLPLYLAGIPYIRSLVWTVSVAGLLMMLAELFA